MTLDRETLEAMIAEDVHGLLNEPPKTTPKTADSRLVEGFAEINTFYAEHGRAPDPAASSISEMQLGMRLEGINADDDKRDALADHDTHGLLQAPAVPETLEDVLNDDAFGLLTEGADLFNLTHVPTAPKKKPDKVARRRTCADFDQFEPFFTQCHADLRSGRRKLLPFKNPSQIEAGKFFVQNGVLVLVAAIFEPAPDNPSNPRTRCIFENGTESDMLQLSLGSSLYENGRRVTEPFDVTLQRMGLDPNTQTGVVYVLKSLSTDPQITGIKNLHKIGSTKTGVNLRIADAENDPTFLNAPVEVIAEYEMPAVIIRKVEDMLHAFFDAVRMDIWFEHRGYTTAQPREWFDVPLDLIDQAIELIESETITSYQYDPSSQTIGLASTPDPD